MAKSIIDIVLKSDLFISLWRVFDLIGNRMRYRDFSFSTYKNYYYSISTYSKKSSENKNMVLWNWPQHHAVINFVFVRLA